MLLRLQELTHEERSEMSSKDYDDTIKIYDSGYEAGRKAEQIRMMEFAEWLMDFANASEHGHEFNHEQHLNATDAFAYWEQNVEPKEKV
jgi:hypothetical protein